MILTILIACIPLIAQVFIYWIRSRNVVAETRLARRVTVHWLWKCRTVLGLTTSGHHVWRPGLWDVIVDGEVVLQYAASTGLLGPLCGVL